MKNYKLFLNHGSVSSLAELFDTRLEKLFSKVTALIKDMIYHRWGDIHPNMLEICIVLFDEKQSLIRGREEYILDTLTLCLTSFLYSTICHKDRDHSEKQVSRGILNLCKLSKQNKQITKTQRKRLTSIKETLTGEHSASNHVTKIVKCLFEKKQFVNFKKLQLEIMTEPHIMMLTNTVFIQVSSAYRKLV